MNIHWKDWCRSWSSNTLATWCEELTRWKRPWCWERLRAGGEGGDRGWDRWMASLTQWTWVWANSQRQWRTGKPGVLQSMGSQRMEHGLATGQQQEDNIIPQAVILSLFCMHSCAFCSFLKLVKSLILLSFLGSNFYPACLDSDDRVLRYVALWFG